MHRQHSQVLEYLDNAFKQEDDLLQNIRECAPKEVRNMQVGPHKGKLLSMFMRLLKAKSVLEIGTCVGYSAIWLARGMNSKGTLCTIEKSQKYCDIAKHNINLSEVANMILVFNGDGLEIIKETLLYAPFDAIFIDANKLAYLEYLRIAKSHIRLGGLIIADNTSAFDSIYSDDEPKDDKFRQKLYKVMRQFNQEISDDKNFLSNMILTPEGMTIGMRIR
ncbi:MAG: O-methyltransferase [Proteobacteria bacterium]|nr:O-methyltransferase [Pseudomonadota bacterium]